MTLLTESKLTLRLALPLMIGQLSQMQLGVADTVMIGRLGVTELAALTFASALFHIPFVFGLGVLTGVSVAGASVAADSIRHAVVCWAWRLKTAATVRRRPARAWGVRGLGVPASVRPRDDLREARLEERINL